MIPFASILFWFLSHASSINTMCAMGSTATNLTMVDTVTNLYNTYSVSPTTMYTLAVVAKGVYYYSSNAIYYAPFASITSTPGIVTQRWDSTNYGCLYSNSNLSSTLCYYPDGYCHCLDPRICSKYYCCVCYFIFSSFFKCFRSSICSKCNLRLDCRRVNGK